MAALVSSAWEGVAETNPERLAGAISICEAVQVWARAAFSQMQEKWGVISSPPTPPPGVAQRLPGSAGAASCGLGGCGKQVGLCRHFFGGVPTKENLRHLKRRDGATLQVFKGNPSGLAREKPGD